MKNWLGSLWAAIKRLFTRDMAEAIQRGVEQAAPYTPAALEIARAIAVATPNRIDDEIVAAAAQFGAAITPGQEIGEQLRSIALTGLRYLFPLASASALNLALELAVGALKAAAKPKAAQP